MHDEKRGWAITGNLGLYIGWWFTRADAIAAHVACYEPLTSEYAVHGRLNSVQRAAWKRRKKVGDRAVRVRVTVEVSP